ncbi:hypothetical protein Taro_017646, partial [Colocasia esculenta]|nr:hypothetical protein [Colocasia esculenta]
TCVCVLGVLSRYWCCTVEVCVVFLDTLTPVFELYVRLREIRQWDSDFPEFVLVLLHEMVWLLVLPVRPVGVEEYCGLGIGLPYVWLAEASCQTCTTSSCLVVSVV